MPGGDRTGPNGLGPMTGRRRGFCAGYDVPGYLNPEPGFGFGPGRGAGRGFGRGFGRGRGFRWRFLQQDPARFQNAPVQGPQETSATPAENEKAYLENEKKAIEQEEEILKKEKESILKRLSEINEKK